LHITSRSGHAIAQFNSAVLLDKEVGIIMNKSCRFVRHGRWHYHKRPLAAHYSRLSADQELIVAPLRCGFLLLRGDGITMNKSLAVHFYNL
jgi:TPR repeat protein